jgi:hypothetical protein
MTEIKDFIIENQLKILGIIGIVIIMLVIIKIRDINLNEPKPESKLVQEVTIETFSERDVEPSCPNMYSRNFSKL